MNQRLHKFYQAHLQKYGANDPRALAWRGSSSQQSRFRVLCEIADLSNSTILDEGCGLGDLYPYLQERFSGIYYTGVDIHPAAIETARNKYPAVTFIAEDFSTFTHTPFDYVLSSGALTFRIGNADAVYREHIQKMFALCTKGVAFNVLDKHVIQEDEEYIGYDEHELYDFCKTITPVVVVRRDYSTEDMTFYLYRSKV